MTPELITTREAAERYRVLPLTIIELAKAGKFKAAKIGHLWRIDRASLEAYFESSSTQPKSNG
jgi:excisionase family DNA binding protein